MFMYVVNAFDDFSLMEIVINNKEMVENKMSIRRCYFQNVITKNLYNLCVSRYFKLSFTTRDSYF